MKTKLYFAKIDSERCYPIRHIIDCEKYWGARKGDEITVFEAKEIKVPNFMFCKIYGSGEKGHCGKSCKDYTPLNGKSGCCKFIGKLYERGEKVTFVID